MTTSYRSSAAYILRTALPWMQRDFLLHGPLRGILPDELRVDIVLVFTDVVCRAIEDGDLDETDQFVGDLMREGMAAGATPEHFTRWIDRYSEVARSMMDAGTWTTAQPVLEAVRRQMAVKVRPTAVTA